MKTECLVDYDILETPFKVKSGGGSLQTSLHETENNAFSGWLQYNRNVFGFYATWMGMSPYPLSLEVWATRVVPFLQLCFFTSSNWVFSPCFVQMEIC